MFGQIFSWDTIFGNDLKETTYNKQTIHINPSVYEKLLDQRKILINILDKNCNCTLTDTQIKQLEEIRKEDSYVDAKKTGGKSRKHKKIKTRKKIRNRFL